MTTAKSLYRASKVVPLMRLSFLSGHYSSRVSEILVEAHAVSADRSDLCMRLDNDLMPGVLIAATTTSSYLELRRRGFEISALRYEDLVARPLEMCRVVLEYCHLPVSLAEMAVKAFDVDSHRNAIMAESAIGRFKEPQLTPEMKTKLNELLKKCGMPLIGEQDIIEGTLSCC